MESMITVLYLEKSRKFKKFKARETWAPSTQKAQFLAQDSCSFYVIGKYYFPNTWYAFNNHTSSIQKFQEHIPNYILFQAEP